eukprot:symbB.v1.2.028751.t1/scaffold3072.1/size64214/2
MWWDELDTGIQRRKAAASAVPSTGPLHMVSSLTTWVLLAIIMLMPLSLAHQRATAEQNALTDMQMAQSAQYRFCPY